MFAVPTFSRVACSLPTQGAAGRLISLTLSHRCWRCQSKLNYALTQSELKHLSHGHTPDALTHYQPCSEGVTPCTLDGKLLRSSMDYSEFCKCGEWKSVVQTNKVELYETKTDKNRHPIMYFCLLMFVFLSYRSMLSE